MTRLERELMRLRMQRLGEEWDARLRLEWRHGRPAAQLARDYGLDPATVEVLIPRTLRKRKAG